MTKREVADRLLDRVARPLDDRDTDAQTSAAMSPAGASMTATPETPRRLTVADITKLYADGVRIPMLTAYDYPTARIFDEAGIPLLLVGDSLGQVLLGYETTMRVTMTEMLHHTKAVVRGTQRALVVADMPFLSYATRDEAVENAGSFMREARRPGREARGGRPLARGSSRRWSRPASR